MAINPDTDINLLEKYIKEVIRKFEADNKEIRKENVPYSPGDHPEMDYRPKLNEEGIKKYQSIIRICQWISVAELMDITFAVSSLSRFSSAPRELQLKKTIKILGYLKKYYKKR